MPFLVEYLLKVSIGLIVVSVLYWLLLKRLTFYYWTRAYFLIFSMLSLGIPFVNITPAIENVYLAETFIQSVPTISSTVAWADPVVLAPPKLLAVDGWSVAIAMWVGGMLIMTGRFILRLNALRKIIHYGQHVLWGNQKICYLGPQMQPFSFGDIIFLNPDMYEENERRNVIQHEMVHVKQRHTIDVLWSEALLIINWFNPAAWWLRQQLRQNLEFIADQEVLASGLDKKAYQYLLLKSSGNSPLSIVHSFNLSPLGRRIAMMNRLKHSRRHLWKFVCIVPVVVLMLLAFRNAPLPRSENTYLLTGLVYDGVHHLPISGAIVRDVVSGITGETDSRGFYRVDIPFTTDELEMKFRVSARGYPEREMGHFTYNNALLENVGVVLVTLAKDTDVESGKMNAVGVHGIMIDKAEQALNYEFLLEKMEQSKARHEIAQLQTSNSHPVQIVNGIPYIFTQNASAWFSKQEVENSPECKVWVEGKIMTIEEVNTRYNRYQFDKVGAVPRASAKRIFDIDCNLLLLYKDSIPPLQNLK